MIHEETTEFSWETIPYEHREKSTDWYWALGILVVVGAIIAFLNRNFLFGFLIIFGGFMIALFAAKKPNHLSIEISSHGIAVNGVLIKYNSVDGFWLYRNPFGVRKVIFKTQRNFTHLISVPIPDDIIAGDLRKFLLTQIPEIELQESFADLFMERIGF